MKTKKKKSKDLTDKNVWSFIAWCVFRLQKISDQLYHKTGTYLTFSISPAGTKIETQNFKINKKVKK